MGVGGLWCVDHHIGVTRCPVKSAPARVRAAAQVRAPWQSGAPASVQLEVASPRLFQLQRFKERLEVALPEGLASPPADDLKEQGRAVLQRLGEQLQQIAVVVRV